MSEKGIVRKYRHEVYDYLEENPAVRDALATWLSSGGERTLTKLQGMARGDLFPYTAPQHVQASFGAFLGGVDWAVRTLRNAVAKSLNMEERRRMVAQAEGDSFERRVLDEIMPGWEKMEETKKGKEG